MLFYFNGEQLDKLKEVVATVKKDDHCYGSYVARRILEKINFDKLQISDDNILTISDGKLSVKEYNHYDDRECAQIEEEIKAEIKKLFGVESSVRFYISDTDEEEPDPIPPMYWGTLDTVYCYSLVVKLML